MRIGKKTIHSVIIGLAMALPILYLGGSMIAGLAGAHGERLFNAEEVEKTFVLSESDFYKGALPLDTFGRYNPSPEWATAFFECVGNFNIVNLQETFPSNGRFTLRWYDDEGQIVAGQQLVGSNSYTYAGDYHKFSVSLYSITDPNALVSVLDTRVTILSNSDYFEGVAYSDYLFGNFFPKNNFVERIGQNALSENPKGFAPFGTMLSYLDDNMFHAGDSQTALMVYGMVYWSLHVVLADLVYHVLVFVPNLINKVFDWFGQKGVSDD